MHNKYYNYFGYHFREKNIILLKKVKSVKKIITKFKKEYFLMITLQYIFLINFIILLRNFILHNVI